MINPLIDFQLISIPILQIFSGIAIILTLLNYFPYILKIRNKTILPHFISWIIWSLTTFIVFLATLVGGGGIGAIPIGISGIITFYVAYLAFKNKAALKIYILDWIYLFISLSSIPIWYLSNDPFWATVILTTVYTIGFLPTLRKSINKPYEENLLFYFIFFLRNMLVIFSLEKFTPTTLLFPIIVNIDCAILILLVLVLRMRTSVKEIIE